jgi:CHAT domain-containing protein/Tfp pilus assembly protein PilF
MFKLAHTTGDFMRYSGLLLILFMMAILPAKGQRKANVDTVAAFRAFEEGKRLEKVVAKYDSAITSYQQAAEGYKVYALSLPEKKKWVAHKKRAWEQYYRAQANIGWCLYGTGRVDTSLKLLLETRAACSQVLGDSSLVIGSIATRIGTIYYDEVQFTRALENYHQALAIFRARQGEQSELVAYIYNCIGAAYSNIGQFTASLDCFKRALAVGKKTLGELHPSIALRHNNIGLTYYTLGQLTQALANFHQALAIEKQAALIETHPEIVADSYHSLGMVYSDQGQFNKAIEYSQQALAIWKQINGEHHPDVASSYNNIGLMLYKQGQYNPALAYFKQALAIEQQTLGEKHPAVAESYHNLAIYSSTQDQYEQALEYCQQALGIWKEVFGVNHPSLAYAYVSIGLIYNQQGQHEKAMEHLRQAESIWQRSLANQHPDVAANSCNIGMVYISQGQLALAIEQFQQSIRAYLPNYARSGYRSLLSHSSAVLKYPLLSLPHSLRRRNAPGDDTLALATVRFADRYIDSLRRAYTYENDKIELGSNAHKLYQAAIDVAKWNQLDEEAFYFSEQNKAAVLAQSLNEATALKLGGVPDSLLEKDKALRMVVSFYTKASIDEELNCPNCDSTKLQNLKSGLFESQYHYTTLKEKLEREFPQYFALKYKHEKMSVKELQQGFLSENPNSAILEYLLGDSVLYAFCITKDKYSFHSTVLDTTNHPNTNALQLQAEQLAKVVGNPKLTIDPPIAFSKLSSTLYDYLINPFEEQIKGKDLIIIPDGELNKIPFEMLIKPDLNLKTISKWQDLPFLIQQHNISYYYSARLLLDDWQKNKTQPVKSSGFVAFAPVFDDTSTGQIVSNENVVEQSYLTYVSRQDTFSRAFTNDRRLITPLPGTEREVKAIYEIFNQKNQPAKYYLNDQANEATVKSLNLKPYKYLHFATHGLTDEDRPTNSCLILAQKQDSTSDNLLTSSEMYGLELDAELVVLSACQTGKGTLKAGEGIIGLTRGLLYAGARNLLVSQWNVNDASTAELMTKFYSKILAGQSNRQALREAKLELLNSKFACPHYWSAFVLVGR